MASEFSIDGVAREITIVRRRPSLVLRIGGRDYTIEEEASTRMRVNGEPVAFTIARDGAAAFVHRRGRHWLIETSDSRDKASAAHEGADIRAPMPGLVVALHKREGETVARGETIVTIESMKLQMALSAPRDGTIARLLKKTGEAFDKDEIVATLAPDGAE